jgi:hypothetical protein
LASSLKAASALALCGGALLVVEVIALGGCGARDAIELFGATGADITGAGGAGGSASNTGGTSSVSASSSTAVSSSIASVTSVTSVSSTSVTSVASSAEASSTSGPQVASSSASGMPITVVALPEGSSYFFWDSGSVAANWFDPAFDDSSWEKGLAPLGFGDPHIVTTVGFGPNPQSKFITTWFRTAFNVMNAASVTGATLELLRDDGARIFLNGVEAARSNMPNGAINNSTLASNIVDGNEEDLFFSLPVDPALFVEGQNVLAIEVHQAVANSSDLGIDARIILEQLSP